MLLSLKEVQGYKLLAKDGAFGEIRHFLVDTFNWVVRYTVVQVGSRQVMLAMPSVAIVDNVARTLLVNLTSEKIMNSPVIPLDRPFLRVRERELFDYYEWPYYWNAADVPTTLPGDLSAVPLIDMELDREQKEEEMIPQTGKEEDPHLYRTDMLFGATIHASNDDHDAGSLEDLIVGDEDWEVLYMGVNAGGMLSPKKVVVAPTWVEQMDALGSTINVRLTSDTIQNSPDYKDVLDLNEDYQARLRNYYEKK